MMFRKWKCGNVEAICFAKMKFFHPSVLLCEKKGKAVVNKDSFDGLKFTGDCQPVFSHHSQNESDGYDSTHPDFPSITFQVAKNHV